MTGKNEWLFPTPLETWKWNHEVKLNEWLKTRVSFVSKIKRTLALFSSFLKGKKNGQVCPVNSFSGVQWNWNETSILVLRFTIYNARRIDSFSLLTLMVRD